MLYRVLIFSAMLIVTSSLEGDDQLEQTLRAKSLQEIEAIVRLKADAKRGALVFHKSAAACGKCHAAGADVSPLGPDLAKIGAETTLAHIVESLLDPSKSIRKGYETVSVAMNDGRVLTGMIAKQDDTQIVLRDASNLLQETIVDRRDVEEMVPSKTSMMPNRLIASLREERDFYDLVRYLREISSGGPDRAKELQPSPQELIVVDDTLDLDHAKILKSLGEADFKIGQGIFEGHCINCHGSDGNTPKLPTARALGTQKLRFGADPYRMFVTVSRGAGLMAPLSHLSPKERYQVVHYVREALMKDRNSDYAAVSDAYLAELPKGTSLGEREQAGDRDFGPVLASQLGQQVNNGLTFRLKDNVAVCYDLHRMRFAAAWKGWLDLSETHHYRQRGEGMPQVGGDEIPGLGHWQWEFNGSFDQTDARPPRGAIREDWLQHRGHYLHDDRAILSYSIHNRDVLESIDAVTNDGRVSLVHTLNVGPSDRELRVSVAQLTSTGGPAGLVDEANSTVLPLKEPKAPADRAAFATTGQPPEQNVPKPEPNRARHMVDGEDAKKLDLGTTGRTTLVRFRTDDGGTLIASTPASGVWKPNGKTLIVRGGRLVYDIGWVGAMSGQSDVADGQWHVAALVVDDESTRMYVDGKLEAEQKGFRRDPVEFFVLKIGATATNFGGDLKGDVAWVRIHDRVWSAKQLAELTSSATAPNGESLFAWEPGSDTTPAVEANDDGWGLISVAQVLDDVEGLTWSRDNSGRLILTIPPSDTPRQFRIVRSTLEEANELASFRSLISGLREHKRIDMTTQLKGGAPRWPQRLEVSGSLGQSVNGYALDTIPVPFENPWNAWVRTSALDFFDDGRCVVTTHGGDVYIVSGIDQGLSKVTWKRFTAGLFEPFGVRVINGMIYVTCRDGLKRLHDFNGDDEADFIEAFWNDDDVSSSFHAFNFDLQTDSLGNFYFAKAGQYTDHHRPGTIMRVPPEGHRADVVAWGLRTPNGMGKLADDRFTVSDNQGPWMPAGKISLIRPDSFLGNMPINKEQTAWLKERHGGKLPKSFDEPIVWTPQELDNSCGGQVWAADERFGPLAGRMIHSSFGKGWLYSMSLQEVGDVMQGAIMTLPHQWDAGVMRMRFNPKDGQLYGVGLSGWQGPAGGLDGCLQRLRYTGEDVQMIDRVTVVPNGIELSLTFDVDPESACNPESYSAEMWDYEWSERYGSDQFSVRKPGQTGHDQLTIQEVQKIDAKTIRLVIPDIAVCDQLELRMLFNDAAQRPFAETAFMTIHVVPEE